MLDPLARKARQARSTGAKCDPVLSRAFWASAGRICPKLATRLESKRQAALPHIDEGGLRPSVSVAQSALISDPSGHPACRAIRPDAVGLGEVEPAAWLRRRRNIAPRHADAPVDFIPSMRSRNGDQFFSHFAERSPHAPTEPSVKVLPDPAVQIPAPRPAALSGWHRLRAFREHAERNAVRGLVPHHRFSARSSRNSRGVWRQISRCAGCSSPVASGGASSFEREPDCTALVADQSGCPGITGIGGQTMPSGPNPALSVARRPCLPRVEGSLAPFECCDIVPHGVSA